MTYNGPGSGAAAAVSSDIKSGGNKAGTKADVRLGAKSGKKPGTKAGMKTGTKAGMRTGMALKGQRIEVWWAQDERFYAGVITSYKKVICCKGFSCLKQNWGLVLLLFGDWWGGVQCSIHVWLQRSVDCVTYSSDVWHAEQMAHMPWECAFACQHSPASCCPACFSCQWHICCCGEWKHTLSMQMLC